MEYIDVMKEFIKPELMVLIPVLYFIGVAVRRSDKIRNEDIPALMGIVGILIALLYVIATCEVYTVQGVLMAAFTAITQGVLVAGASVYADQLLKQLRNKKDVEEKEETSKKHIEFSDEEQRQESTTYSGAVPPKRK